MSRLHTPLLGLMLATSLTACNLADPPEAPTAPADPQSPRTALGRTVDKAMDEARRELANENISINEGITIGDRGGEHSASNLPKAEITPAGDLLVDGRTVAVNAQQRALLLKYRSHFIGIVEAGMAMGVRGADLGMAAASDAIGSIFSGDTEGVEKRVEAEAAKLEAEAVKLCAQLAPMLATQRELAASLPAFAPYATMTQADVDECMSEGDGGTRAAVQERVRTEVRGAVRESIRGARDAGDPAAEAAAAGDDASTASSTPTR